jgi:putative Mn2+ efflux pump MntP
MFEVLLVAIAVGLGNFAAAIGIGIAGVRSHTRPRVGLVFGGFEAMPLIGILLGRQVARLLGSRASLLGGSLLIATGLYGLIQARRHHGTPGANSWSLRQLVLVGAALSIDNLVVGLAIGTAKVSVLLAAGDHNRQRCDVTRRLGTRYPPG